MGLVAGASQFVNTVAYNTSRGTDPLAAASSPSLLGGFDSNISLLEIGKQFSQPGIGLSSRARAVTNEFLAQSQGGINTILSASAQNTIDGANTQIKALQASLPASAIGSFSGRFDLPETGGNEFNTLGGNVDIEA